MVALNTTSFSLLPQNPKPISLSRVSSFICRAFTKFPGDSDSDDSPDEIPGRRSNYSGVKLEETVDSKTGKLRLDSWVSSRIDGVSRARVQSSIRSGLVSVNGRVTDKVPLLYTQNYICSKKEFEIIIHLPIIFVLLVLSLIRSLRGKRLSNVVECTKISFKFVSTCHVEN